MAENGKIVGVNLGGWLVLERWMTPSLFKGTDAKDEHSFVLLPDGRKKIEAHRKKFITEDDFRWLAAHGVNFVRIPVGYWLFEPIDGFEPTVKYLDNAVLWAEKHDIKVLIELHAARGSQNGFHHGGKAGEARWFAAEECRQQTLDVLTQIATRYRDSPALWGIGLLNEPQPGKGQFKILRAYHREAYRQLTQILQPQTAIVFHDAFKPWRTITTFGKQFGRPKNPIYIDIHWYAFSLKTTHFDRYLRISGLIRRLSITLLQLWHPVIIGEWSSVLPGRFFQQIPKDQHDELLRRNIAMQQTAYRGAAGQIYWSYKVDGPGMWSFRSLVETGHLVVDNPPKIAKK